VERAYRHSTRLLGALIALLGVAMLVTTLARGGGPLALGVVLGALFAVLGSARVYLAREGPPRDEGP
jgi:drug/metabolite transporter (DMT)-like permease